MQVTEVKSEGLKREFKVAVPAAEIEKNVLERLEELSKTVKIPGFRPGKVPVSLLRKRYGQSVMGEVLEKTVKECSGKLMEERSLRPALQPKIEVSSFEEGGDLEYDMAFEVIPEIEPMDFAAMKLERMVVEPDEEGIKKTLDHLADTHKTSEPIKEKRKAKKSDMAVIDFVGKVDGEEFPGGKAEDYSLELGSGSFIPGFEEQVIGAATGDKIEVKVAFPKEYGAANLAGKDAVFDVTLKELRQPVPAPIDDDLAKKVGVDDLEALKKAIGEEHGREFKELSRFRLKRSMLDALAENYDFEVPEGLQEKEFEGIWRQFEEQRKSNPESLSSDEAEKSDDELKEEYGVLAERRVRLGLVLAEVGRANNIQLSQEDLNKAIMDEARRYPGQEQEFIDYCKNNPEALQSLSNPVYEDKVADFIFEMAKITDKNVSVDELTKEPEEKPTASAKKSGAKKTKAKKAPKAKKASKDKA
jgi:trigger factor